MVEARNIGKRYGGRWVLREVSLTVAPGRIVALIGPNGAGKSTLLAIVGRIVGRDAGDVLIDGRPLERYSSGELALRLTYLRQAMDVRTRLSVRDLVSFGRFPHNRGRLTKRDREIVDQALEELELTSLAEAYVDELSGGQRQRAFVAMILAQDTPYLLLDEPLSNLDMRYQVHILKILRKRCREEGKGIVISLHDINLASIYADEIVALKDGRVVASGAPCDVVSPAVLRDVFDIDVIVEPIAGQRICIYAQW